YYPREYALAYLGVAQGRRGVSEQCCEEGQTNLGMDPYERQYTGWHHHAFCGGSRCTWGKNSRAETCNDADPRPIVPTQVHGIYLPHLSILKHGPKCALGYHCVFTLIL